MAFPATTPTGMMGYTMVSRNYRITQSISVRSIIFSTPVYSESAVMLSVECGCAEHDKGLSRAPSTSSLSAGQRYRDLYLFFFFLCVLFFMFVGFSALLSPPWALSFKKKRWVSFDVLEKLFFFFFSSVRLDGLVFVYLLSMSGNQCYNSGVAPYFIHNYTLSFIFNKTI